MSGLDFYSFSNASAAARRAPTVTLSHYSLLLSVLHFARVLPIWENTVLQRLLFDD